MLIQKVDIQDPEGLTTKTTFSSVAEILAPYEAAFP